MAIFIHAITRSDSPYHFPHENFGHIPVLQHDIADKSGNSNNQKHPNANADTNVNKKNIHKGSDNKKLTSTKTSAPKESLTGHQANAGGMFPDVAYRSVTLPPKQPADAQSPAIPPSVSPEKSPSSPKAAIPPTTSEELKGETSSATVSHKDTLHTKHAGKAVASKNVVRADPNKNSKASPKSTVTTKSTKQTKKRPKPDVSTHPKADTEANVNTLDNLEKTLERHYLHPFFPHWQNMVQSHWNNPATKNMYPFNALQKQMEQFYRSGFQQWQDALDQWRQAWLLMNRGNNQEEREEHDDNQRKKKPHE